MKNILFWTLLINFSFAKAQRDSIGIQKIGIYLVDWQSRPAMSPSIRNFEHQYRYYFESENIDLDFMFVDFKDQDKKMDSHTLLNDSVKVHLINAMVKFMYKDDTIVVYFDSNGNYYYKQKWHPRPNELYYSLFHYLSNSLIPEEVLIESKKKYRGDFWYE